MLPLFLQGYSKSSRILLWLLEKLFLFLSRINFLIGPIFKFLPLIYTVLSIGFIGFGVLIIILYFFSNFNIIDQKYKNIIDKDTTQTIYNSLYLIQSFLMLSIIVFITYSKADLPSISSVLPDITDRINRNTTGVILIQALLVSIIVIFCLLMSIITTGLTRGYYTLKSQETNQKPSLSWWAKIFDMIMFIFLVIGSLLLVIFFLLKIVDSSMDVVYKSRLQLIFIIPLVYHIAQAILKFLEDIISNNIISFITPSTEEHKTLFFILNIIIAVVLWIFAIPYLLYINLTAVVPIFRNIGETLNITHTITPGFYGIIPSNILNTITPFLKKYKINISELRKNQKTSNEKSAPSTIANTQSAVALPSIANTLSGVAQSTIANTQSGVALPIIANTQSGGALPSIANIQSGVASAKFRAKSRKRRT